MRDMTPAELLPLVEALARQAGALILEVYGRDFEVRHKPDDSPVTEADERAESLIVSALRELTPDWPVVAEEAAWHSKPPEPVPCFWLVDALDGTIEFVSRNGEFTVNIGLVSQGLPVLGVVYIPVLDRLFAAAQGHGAWVVERGQVRRPIHCRPVPREGFTVVGSRSHGDEVSMRAWLAERRVAARLNAGSALKFGMLACGEADLYPRFGRTMEWDTAAGHAVLLEAGGDVTNVVGQVLRYGKPGYENPHFIARGGPVTNR